MNIQIIELSIDQLKDHRLTGGTSFTSSNYLHNCIANDQAIHGIVLIGDNHVKFSYSCLGNDGDIFTLNEEMRTLIKVLIPVYAFNRHIKNHTTVCNNMTLKS